jgi:hypothetical protein
MTRFKILSAGLIAAAMFATPAIAREHHVTKRHVAQNTYAARGARYVEGQGCIRAPRIDAYATQPWDNGPTPCEPGTGS